MRASDVARLRTRRLAGNVSYRRDNLVPLEILQTKSASININGLPSLGLIHSGVVKKARHICAITLRTSEPQAFS
jgi:hypothetical protein